MAEPSLIERLREADRGSVQRALGSRIFGEAASTLEDQARLIRELGEMLEKLTNAADEDVFVARAGVLDPLIYDARALLTKLKASVDGATK